MADGKLETRRDRYDPPLTGIRVLAVSQYGAGPYATQLLADLGAEVIKVENFLEGGDIGRRVPPLFSDGQHSLFFESHNRGKWSIALRLDRSEGLAVFKRLAAKADVVFNNLRGDVGKKLGLDYESLKDRNPRLVCVSLSGYGSRGPDASLPGYDYLFQGKAGWMSLTGDPDSYPVKSGLSLVDLSAAVMAALATVSAVLRARQTGIGGDVEVSLYDTALGLLGYIATWVMSRDWVPERLAHSAHPSVVPFQEFATADGHIVIACVKDKFFRELCKALNMTELIEQFPTMEERLKQRAEVTRLLQERFLTAKTAYWIEKLRGRVPCEPVNTVWEALHNGEVPKERGLLIEYDHPVLGSVKTLGTPIIGWWRSGAGVRAPFMGEHTIRILKELAEMHEDDILKLQQIGVIPSEQQGGGGNDETAVR